MSELIKNWLFKHTLIDGGAEYFSERHLIHARMTFSYAVLATFVFSLFELRHSETPLVLAWCIPLLISQLGSIFFSNMYLKTKKTPYIWVFFVFEVAAFFCWLGYLFIFGWHGHPLTEVEIVWRGFIVFVVTTFYLNVMQYSMVFLLTHSSITCFGILSYLLFCSGLPMDMIDRYLIVVSFGWFLLIRFGRSAYNLMCENYYAVAENKKLMAKMDEMLIHDTLTNLHNRRYFDEQVVRHMAMFNRDKKTFCLAMLDIDHFKRINDRYGHQVGDDVLIMLGQVVRENLRRSDIFTRYGGEEFAIILPISSLEAAAEVLVKVRRTVEQHTFEVGGYKLKITVSLGLAISSDNTDIDLLIQKADKALYRAKQLGRNTIQIAS